VVPSEGAKGEKIMKVDKLIEELIEYKGNDYLVCLPELKDIGILEVDDEAHVIHLLAANK
jgi:hypothetical protein